MFKYSCIASVLIGASLLAALMIGHSAGKPEITPAASVNLSGGSGTTWSVRENGGTDNGLPWRSCNAGAQASMSDAQTTSKADAFDLG